MSKRLLIIGANSDIALATARLFASEEKVDILLASRNMEKLEKSSKDIEVRYEVETEALFLDVTDFESHDTFINAIDPFPEIVISAFGYLSDQEKAQSDFDEALKSINSNYIGGVSLLEKVAAKMEERGSGSIIGISSVAGDRGRQSNYIYGSAKAGFNAYLGGLRNRLFHKSVHVMTVLPGFVNTKMTEGLDLPAALTAEPEKVAEDIYNGWRKKKNILYTWWIWRYIMLIIKHIPEPVFKRLRM